MMRVRLDVCICNPSLHNCSLYCRSAVLHPAAPINLDRCTLICRIFRPRKLIPRRRRRIIQFNKHQSCSARLFRPFLRNLFCPVRLLVCITNCICRMHKFYHNGRRGSQLPQRSSKLLRFRSLQERRSHLDRKLPSRKLL